MRYIKGKLKKGFKKRFANVLRILMIFQGGVCAIPLHFIIQNCEKINLKECNFGGNEEISCSTCLASIFRLILGTYMKIQSLTFF